MRTSRSSERRAGRSQSTPGRAAVGRAGTHTEPKPPFPRQKQRKPGIEAEIKPRPRYWAENYRPAGKLAGKIALVTGGDSGIGRAVAVIFAREGADVAINYLAAEERDARETREVIESVGRRCLTLPGDLRDPRVCKGIVERTVKELGGLDVLVSNAAWQNRKESILDVTEEELDRTFKTNVYAYFRLVKAALPHLKRGSAIIATSSETALEGPEELPDYSATKGAIDTLTKSLARQLLDKGIRVNAVAPGPVWTPLNIVDAGATREKVSKFGSGEGHGPLDRPAQPEELAPAYVFLASEADSSYIAGIVLRVMGGKTSAG